LNKINYQKIRNIKRLFMSYLAILCISLFTISNAQSNWAGDYNLIDQYYYNVGCCVPTQITVVEENQNVSIAGIYPDNIYCEELGLVGDEYILPLPGGVNMLTYPYYGDATGTMELFPANNSIVNLQTVGVGAYCMFVYQESPGSNTYNWAGTYNLFDVIPYNATDCSCEPNTLTVTQDSQTQVLTIAGTYATCQDSESGQAFSFSLPITELLTPDGVFSLVQANNSIVVGMGSNFCGVVYQRVNFGLKTSIALIGMIGMTVMNLI